MTTPAIALGLGIVFALLTALELLLGEAALGDAVLLLRTTKINILHWAVALAMLGAFSARRAGARRTTMRVGGMILLAIALWGSFWPAALGTFLGFADGIPAAYNAYHGVAAVLALSAGFLPDPRPA